MRVAHLLGTVASSRRFNPTFAGPHRYWRVLFPGTSADGSTTAIHGVQFHEALNGPDVCTGGTPIASSVLSADYPASKAFADYKSEDYSPVSNLVVWASAAGSDQWVGYDFGELNKKSIVQFGVWPRYRWLSQVTPTAVLQYSDDAVSWTNALDTPMTGFTAGMLKKHPESAAIYGAHRYWRLNFVYTGGGSGLAVGEVELRAIVGGADLTNPTTPVTALSAWSAAYSADKSIDNNNATLYATSGTNAFGYLSYDLVTPQPIEEVMIRARADTAPNTSPVCVGVQFSDDNVKWTTAWTFTVPDAWSLGQVRTFVAPAPIAAATR